MFLIQLLLQNKARKGKRAGKCILMGSVLNDELNKLVSFELEWLLATFVTLSPPLLVILPLASPG